MPEANVWDNGIWSLVKNVKFDFMTLYIMEHILATASFKGKTVLELGAGTGRLSYLALKYGAQKVTLVDSSTKAIELSHGVFKSEASDSYQIYQANILDFDTAEKFDIVLSSGVIEHFKETDRRRIIDSHINKTREYCIIIHPTMTLYSSFFNNFFISKKLYGYQESFSEQEINTSLAAIPEIKQISHSLFHTFYTIPMLHNLEWINRYLDSTSFGQRHGGLTLTKVKMMAEKTPNGTK